MLDKSNVSIITPTMYNPEFNPPQNELNKSIIIPCDKYTS